MRTEKLPAVAVVPEFADPLSTAHPAGVVMLVASLAAGFHELHIALLKVAMGIGTDAAAFLEHAIDAQGRKVKIHHVGLSVMDGGPR